MKKLMVYLDEDTHENLKTLAFQEKTTMAALVRYALDKTFEAGEAHVGDAWSAVEPEDRLQW